MTTGGIILKGKLEILEEKLVPLPLLPPQMPTNPVWDWTWGSE
jgi:hypothetical protein